MDQEAVRLFTEPNIAHIATLMSDGSPQVTAVWADYEDGHVTVNTAEGRVKHKNLQRDARVAISVVSCDDPLKMASVRGTVVGMDADYEYEHADMLTKKYTGAEKYPYRHKGERRTILRIRPEHVHIMRRPTAQD